MACVVPQPIMARQGDSVFYAVPQTTAIMCPIAPTAPQVATAAPMKVLQTVIVPSITQACAAPIQQQQQKTIVTGAPVAQCAIPAPVVATAVKHMPPNAVRATAVAQPTPLTGPQPLPTVPSAIPATAVGAFKVQAATAQPTPQPQVSVRVVAPSAAEQQAARAEPRHTNNNMAKGHALPGPRRYRGSVKSFDANKGFGFIRCDELRAECHRDVFIHKNQFAGFAVGQAVEFDVETNREGFPQARGVRPTRRRGAAGAPTRGTNYHDAIAAPQPLMPQQVPPQCGGANERSDSHSSVGYITPNDSSSNVSSAADTSPRNSSPEMDHEEALQDYDMGLPPTLLDDEDNMGIEEGEGIASTEVLLSDVLKDLGGFLKSLEHDKSTSM